MMRRITLAALVLLLVLLTSCRALPPAAIGADKPAGDAIGSGETDGADGAIGSGGEGGELLDDAPAMAVSPIPAAWRDGGLFSDYYEAAYARLQAMTLEEKVGQMLFARCPAAGAEALIQSVKPGGFVLFRQDFDGKTPEEVIATLAGYQSASDIPMVFAVDEEGGTVVRVSANPLLSAHKFQSPQTVYRDGGLEGVRADAAEKAAMLRALGVQVLLAPVADVSADPADFIYARTFGGDGEATADFVRAAVEAGQAAGVSCTLKHFPGYGGNRDTHTGASLDGRTYEQFETSDFLPFRAGIEAGVHCILVSHNLVACMDENRPASLSPEVHRILREELGFTGIVLTDDLYMDATRLYTSGADPAVLAVLAGNDLVLLTDADGGYRAILDALEDKIVDEALIDRAVFRVLAWKLSLGLPVDGGQ